MYKLLWNTSVKMGKYKDVAECQKITVMFGMYNQILSEVAQFVDILKYTVQHVYQEQCTTGGYEIQC